MNNATQPRRRAGNRASFTAVMMVAISLLLALTVYIAPDASAHAGDFEHDDVAFAESGCQGDSVPNGATVMLRGDEIIGCAHPGYSIIGDNVELCEEARGIFVANVCTFDNARSCGENPAFLYEIGDGMCIRPALVISSRLPEPAVSSRSITPVCVNSDFVQERATSERVGAITNFDGRDYLIVTGATCDFNCNDGWDINCDGKLGDFCPSEYDLTYAVYVGLCVAELATQAES